MPAENCHIGGSTDALSVGGKAIENHSQLLNTDSPHPPVQIFIRAQRQSQYGFVFSPMMIRMPILGVSQYGFIPGYVNDTYSYYELIIKNPGKFPGKMLLTVRVS